MGVATAASVASMATGLLVPPLIPMLVSFVPLFMFYQTSPTTHSPAYRQGKWFELYSVVAQFHAQCCIASCFGRSQGVTHLILYERKSLMW